MTKRIISLTIASMLALIPVVSCGNSTGPGTIDDTTASGGEATTSAAIQKETSGVPEGTNLEGEQISIWYTTASVSVAETYVDLNPDMTGDILDDATYEMNRAVEDKLNCELVFFNSEITTDQTGAEAQKLVLAGDTTYDVFHLVQWNAAKLASEGIYYNMKNAPYLSLDKPWWNAAYMEEMVVGDNALFALVGDYCVDRTRTLNCVYYNKDMYEDFYKDPDDLYNVVLDGKWTIEKYRQICTDAYSDLNNDGIIDLDDRLGSTVNDYNNIDSFFYAAGLRATKRDSNGIPSFCINNERTVTAVEKFYELVFETDGMYFSGPLYEDDVKNRDKFEEGTAMFLPGFFYTSEAMREMKSDFGIVPFPKLDEAQENYVSDVHDIIRLMFLPANCQKVDAVCAVLEEMSFIGYHDVLPAYYDVLMKNKYARDDVSAEMLDIIRENCSPDFAHIYDFNSVGYVGRKLIQQKSDNFASYYAEIIPAGEQELAKIIEQYTELG